MPDSKQPRQTGSAWGILVLVGYFCVLCSLIMASAAVWRTWHEYTISSHWIETQATIQKCGLSVYHPFSRNGGGVVYSLNCSLLYQFSLEPRFNQFRTTSNRSESVRAAIEDWIRQHPNGTVLTIRVNPSDPRQFAVEGPLPIEQFNTAREGWITALLFAALATLLIGLGRLLTARAIRARNS
jgi:hypothetical protein